MRARKARSLRPVIWGKKRGWGCPAVTEAISGTDAGSSLNAMGLPPIIHTSAITIITMPGRTVPMRNPRLVIFDTMELPLKVSRVASQ